MRGKECFMGVLPCGGPKNTTVHHIIFCFRSSKISKNIQRFKIEYEGCSLILVTCLIIFPADDQRKCCSYVVKALSSD